jgi:hypothetical protein
VKRALASLLLSVLTLPLLPAFVETAVSTIPACCRRNGKHHCAKTDDDSQAASGAALRAIDARCPLYPKTSAQPSGSTPIQVSQASFVHDPVLSSPAAAERFENLRSTAYDRSSQKRGPPSLLL